MSLYYWFSVKEQEYIEYDKPRGCRKYVYDPVTDSYVEYISTFEKEYKKRTKVNCSSTIQHINYKYRSFFFIHSYHLHYIIYTKNKKVISNLYLLTYSIY